jgi:sacsin
VNEIKTIKHLPIFQIKNGGAFIKLSDHDAKTQFAALQNSDRLSSELFPPHYINFSTPQELQFLSFLGVIVFPRSQYFIRDFLPRASFLHGDRPNLVEQDLLEMMTEFATLIEEDKKIVSVLKESKCVPNGERDQITQRTLHKPSELFDPLESELYALLDETFFPAPEFQREDVLVHLRTTGLNSTLDWTGIIACARSIESFLPEETKLSPGILSPRQKRGSSLLDYLTKNMNRLLGEEKKVEQKRTSIFSLRGLFGSEKPVVDTFTIEENIRQLVNIEWMPIHQVPLDPFMPWCDSLTTSDVAPPRICRPVSDSWSCSSSMCISRNPVHSTSLLKVFGWNENLPIKVIAVQLRELAAKFISNCATNEVDEAQIQLARERITALIPVLYQRLNGADGDEIIIIQSVLSSHPWIWVGHAFVHPSKVAYTSTLSLAPYLYAVPQDLAVYKRLLDMFGIKQSFNARDFVEVLRQMALETNATTVGNDSKDSNKKAANVIALSDEHIDLAVSLVTFLSAEGGGGGKESFQPLDHLIYVPDNLGKLSIASDLVTDDVPWLTGAEYTTARSGIRLCHPHIASKVAHRVGVRSLRLILVDRSVETLFTETESHMEAFGQAESLTGRLRTILDMYPDGNPILSELIQNADDAGATVVKIMIDENTYPVESLMDTTVSPLQGPALIFCNDSKFTESDFRSLARIGQGSKLEKLSATGRFGLGFNSVYHITDTPSFVSGDHLVIFDPHTSFIPGTTPSQPGLRMKFLGNSLKNTFPDQFRPYQYFGCNFEETYDGTFFRFPLRTPSLARKSEISKTSYSIQDVNNLLEHLTAHLANYLIFLRSVSAIEIYRCREGEAPSLIQRATSHISGMSAYNDQRLLHCFDKKFALGLQIDQNKVANSSTSRDAFYTDLAATPDHKLPSCTYIVKIQTEVVDAISLTPNQNSHSVEYLICTGIRGGKAKAMACDSRTRHLKLVPMGSIAACLSNTNDQLSFENGRFPILDGLAFCFLPLPVRTNLPVHVNAYFELSSNRRDIWRGDDTTGESKVRGEWNTRLMEDVLAPLYVLLLTKLAIQLKKNPNLKQGNLDSIQYHQIRQARCGIYSLIPSATAALPWNLIRQTVFTQIQGTELLWSNLNGGGYFPVGETIIFTDSRLLPNSATESENVETMDRLEEILLLEGIPLAIVPPSLYQSLHESNVVSGALTSQFVRNHFKMTIPHRSISPPLVSNAAFLLEYCLRDNPTPSDLFGLRLVPMENSECLGCLGDPTDPPLYIASEYERRLLGHVGQSIIANDQTLGNKVALAIKSQLFNEKCNVEHLTPLTTLKLLQYVVPSHWFSSGTSIVNRYELVNGTFKELVSLDWIQGIWAYILETKSLHLFEHMIPIVPIIQPPTLPKGSYLVKFSSSIPILHMSLKENLSPEAFRGISDLGLYIFDPSGLGSIAYSQELSQFLCEPTPKGFLKSFCSIKDRILTASASWNENVRDALRILLLDNILAKVDNLLQEEIEMLRMFPIYEQHDQSKRLDRVFSSLTLPSGELLSIPPRNISNEDLLNNKFIKIRNDRDRTLYSMMGLVEPSSGVFYSMNVLPSILNGVYSESTLSLLSIELLRHLSTLENESPGFTEHLKTCPFVKNSKGQFSCPELLYDPQAPYLPSILPSDAFPCPKLYNDGILLASMRLVGLSTNLTTSGILRAAESIHRDFEGNKVVGEEDGKMTRKMTPTPTVSLEKQENIRLALQRANNLIRYLDLNIDELMKSENSDWAFRLKDLIWIPVSTEPPQTSRIANNNPPWPESLHRFPLARPSHCSLTENIWICSTTHRIVKFEPQSELLVKILGWDNPISGRCVTSQLFSLIDLHSALPDKLSEVCYQIVPRIYTTLMHAMETESDVEIEIWSRSLKGKPFVWTSGLFVEPNRISFTPLSSINTEPYLFVAKGELISYRPFLLRLGVKEAFGVTDLTSLLRDLSLTYGSSPLPSEKVDMCLGIVKIIVRLIVGDEPKEKTKGDSDDDSEAHSEDDANEIKANELMKISEAMGDVFLPDKNHVLTLSKNLTFDDAPWLSSQLSSRGIRFVHRLIDNEAAFLLGARSLREQLFSGDAIVCPDMQAIRGVLGTDTIEDSLGDLIGLADKLGSTGVHIVLDDRMHSCESLIHPGLAAAQGISILVFIEGVNLSVESLSQLLISPVHLPELPATLSPNALPPDGNDCVYNFVGKRLHAAFAVTDCLQVLSGNQFYVFDPCGQFLIGAGDEREATQHRSKVTSANRNQSKAQRYLLNGKDGQSMLARFPDQFEGLLSLPLAGSWNQSFRSMGHITGTILRLPLRKESSFLSSNVITTEALRPMLRGLIGRVEGSLVFSQYLQTTSIQRCQLDPANGDSSNEYFEIRLVNASQTHGIRRKTIADASWKKSGGLFLWKQPILTVEASYRAVLAYLHKSLGDILPWFGNSSDTNSSFETKTSERSDDQNSTWQIEWITRCIQGMEANRQLANKDPYKRLDLQPFISISAPIFSSQQLQDMMTKRDSLSFSRFVYCNSGNLGGDSSGLPFHIDGSFVMVIPQLAPSLTLHLEYVNAWFEFAGFIFKSSIELEHSADHCSRSIATVESCIIFWGTRIIGPSIAPRSTHLR